MRFVRVSPRFSTGTAQGEFKGLEPSTTGCRIGESLKWRACNLQRRRCGEAFLSVCERGVAGP